MSHDPINPVMVRKFGTVTLLWRGACSCGWEANGFGSESDAWKDARQHADALNAAESES